MRLALPLSDLAALVTRGVSAAPKNSPALIANNARIIARNGTLRIATCDFHTMVEAIGPATVEKCGSITVDAAKLKQVVDRFQKGTDVTITMDDKRNLIVKAGRSRVTFSTLPAEDWPELKADITDGARFEMSGVELADLLKDAVHAVGPATQTALSGVFLHVREWKGERVLAAVATSGTTLILSTTPLPVGADCLPVNGETPGVILDPGFINAALRLMRNAEKVVIEADAGKITLFADDVRLTSTLVDAIYPDYERAICDPGADAVKVDRARLVSSLNLMETFTSREQGHRLQCAGSDDGLVLAAVGTTGDGVDIVDAEIDGDVGAFGISGALLKIVVDAFGSEVLALHPESDKRRVVVLADNAPGKLGVVATMAIPTNMVETPRG